MEEQVQREMSTVKMKRRIYNQAMEEQIQRETSIMKTKEGSINNQWKNKFEEKRAGWK
jgi:hypothetical protein